MSAYRRQLSYEELADYNESLCEDLRALGNTAALTLGDWNHDPLTDPLNVQAAGARAVVHYPATRRTGKEEEQEPQDPLPAPTRWDSNRCIDWGLCCKVHSSVKVLPDKWSDHKLLEWEVTGLASSGGQSYKLRQASDLRKPDDVSDEQWEKLVARHWDRLEPDRQGLDMTDWQQLSTAVEKAFRAALRELGSQRRFTTNNYKGRVAAAIPVCSHHRPSPEGVPKVRTTRLRRLGRRIE